MNELPKQAADLLAEARASHSASAQELERGLSRLHAQLEFSDVGADLGGDVGAPAEPWSSAHGFFAHKLVKVALSALAVSGGVALTYLAYPSAAPSAATRAAKTSADQLAQSAHTERTAAEAVGTVVTGSEARARDALPARALPEARPADAIEGADVTPKSATKSAAHVPTTRPASPRRSAAQLSARSAPAATPVAESPTAESTTDSQIPASSAASAERSATASIEQSSLAELDLIDAALRKLRSRDATAALDLLDEHARRYPAGKLSVERRGLHAVALCAAGRLVAGRAEQATFLARDSSAPVAERVRRACKEER